MKISRILHAGYILESADTRIAFDPILETPFSTNAHAFPEIQFRETMHVYNAIFLSHFHDDHCSLTSLNKIDRKTPIYLYCVHDELFDFIRELGFAVHRLNVGVTVDIGAFQVTPRLALDADIDTVFEIVVESFRIMNVIDAWLDSATIELFSKQKWDLILWPFQTMRELAVLMPSRAETASRELPFEWVEQLELFQPRFVVPSSCQFKFEDWSWYNRIYFPITYAQFAREIPNSVRMNPGVTFELTADSFAEVGSLPWIEPVGPKDVDYDFDETLSAPPTNEIAKHFPELTPTEWKLVETFARDFDVTLFDQNGGAHGSGPTEVIAYKLQRALEHGEMLTSMYLRTPDFDTDPLIAALSKDPLAYQRAQLKKLSQSK